MSKSLLVAAIATIMPVAQADVMDSYFQSDVHPMLVVRNKLTNFYHVLYLQDGEVKNFNVGSSEDFAKLSIAAHASAPNKVYSINDALAQWDDIIKEGSEAAAKYVMGEIEAYNSSMEA